jgi:hypothetical protein
MNVAGLKRNESGYVGAILLLKYWNCFANFRTKGTGFP